MIRRTLKKKPSLVKNKTGKRKNTKGIKRNRRKVHKTRKRKSGTYHRGGERIFPRILVYDEDGLHSDLGKLGRKGLKYIRKGLKYLSKMPKNTRDKYRDLYNYLSNEQNLKSRERINTARRYKGGEESEHLTKEYIMNLIKNIGHGDDGVSLCDHIKALTPFFNFAKDEEIRTELTEKINELKEKGNCENITTETLTEPSAEAEELSAEEGEEVEQTTQEV